MDVAKVALGYLLFAVSFLVLAASGATSFEEPLSVAAFGSVGLSFGTLLADAVF